MLKVLPSLCIMLRGQIKREAGVKPALSP